MNSDIPNVFKSKTISSNGSEKTRKIKFLELCISVKYTVLGIAQMNRHTSESLIFPAQYNIEINNSRTTPGYSLVVYKTESQHIIRECLKSKHFVIRN